MRTGVELSLYPKQGVVIDTSIYTGADNIVETDTIINVRKDVNNDECKEVDEDDDGECKEVDENIRINSSNIIGEYVVGVNILDMPYVANDDNHHIIVKPRNDYNYPMHPLFYAILGFIIIIVVTFVSV